MSVGLVARRYARALAELALEQGRIDAVVEEVASFARAWAENAELRNALENPLVSHAAKKAVMSDLAKALQASPTTREAVLLLVDRRRISALPAIAAALKELADSRKGVVRAEVTSASALSDGYLARLRTQLEKLTGMRVAIEARTDPSLIGGIVTRIGYRVLDGSVATRLQSIRDTLVESAS